GAGFEMENSRGNRGGAGIGVVAREDHRARVQLLQISAARERVCNGQRVAIGNTDLRITVESDVRVESQGGALISEGPAVEFDGPGEDPASEVFQHQLSVLVHRYRSVAFDEGSGEREGSFVDLDGARLQDGAIDKGDAVRSDLGQLMPSEVELGLSNKDGAHVPAAVTTDGCIRGQCERVEAVFVVGSAVEDRPLT